jgi:uncharacterized protein
MYLNLLDIPDTGIELDRLLDLRDLRAEDGGPLVAEGARLQGSARPGPRGVVLRAMLRATARLQCSRCLESFSLPLVVEFELVLVRGATEAGEPGETEMRPEDADLFPLSGDQADLRSISSEQIHLNLPLKPVCRADCRGLCPACGANRNQIECGCRSEESDPRLTPLRELRDRMGGKR